MVMRGGGGGGGGRVEGVVVGGGGKGVGVRQECLLFQMCIRGRYNIFRKPDGLSHFGMLRNFLISNETEYCIYNCYC